jgi:hypothetical protein
MNRQRLKVTLRRAILPCLIAMIIPPVSNFAADSTFTDANWSSLASGMNGSVRALAVSGTNLYAGGSFTLAGGVPANYVAKWNGSTWSPLGSGVNSAVRALAVSGTNLYAGGVFTTAGGNSAKYVARWNGSAWSAIDTGMTGYEVDALAISGTNLYAGGSFSMAGFGTAYNIAVWGGKFWSKLGYGYGLDNTVYSLAVSGDNLYAGGDFIRVDSSITVNSIAKWNGSSWSALGTGMGGTTLNSVYALAVSGSDVHAAGFFINAGNISAHDIATWNGNSWSSPGWFGTGTNYYPSVYALAMAGNDLYAGGDFTIATGIPANRVAKWDGVHWWALGSGVNGTVRSLAVSGNDLYVGGDFTTAGNKSAPYIARAYLLDLPTLSISQSDGGITISWPSTDTGFVLEQSASLARPIHWLSNTSVISDDGINLFVTLPATNSVQFFRLRRP